MTNYESYDLTLVHPSRILIFGPSGSGKTTFVENLLYYMKDMFGFIFDRIIYFSGQSFPKFNRIHGREIEMLTEIDEKFLEDIDETKKNLLIIDDNMHRIGNDIVFSDLFTMKSRHRNITVILLVQNLFPKSKYMRDISANANYLTLMNNPRELHPVNTLNTQIYGKKSQFLKDAYSDATSSSPFSYLFLDFNQTTNDKLRTRTNIFPNEQQIAYIKVPEI